MEKVTALLEQLDAAIRKADPKFHHHLRPGADDDAISKLRGSISELPNDVEQWFRWHDGSNEAQGFFPDSSTCQIGVQDAVEFLSSQKSVENVREALPGSGAICPLTSDYGGFLELYVSAPGEAIVVRSDHGRIVSEHQETFVRWLEALVTSWTAAATTLSVSFLRIARTLTGWTDLQVSTKDQTRFRKLAGSSATGFNIVAGGLRVRFRAGDVAKFELGEEKRDAEGWLVRQADVVVPNDVLQTLSRPVKGESSVILDSTLELKLSFCDR